MSASIFFRLSLLIALPYLWADVQATEDLGTETETFKKELEERQKLCLESQKSDQDTPACKDLRAWQKQSLAKIQDISGD